MTVASGNILSVLLVEGPTEGIFYGRIKDKYLQADCACRIESIEGLFNVNKKVLHALKTKNTDRPVRAYCCLDRESRHAPTPQFDLRFIRAELKKENVRNVLSVDQIIAVQMIESWFFHDIMGIYKYLRVPRVRRDRRAYTPVERFRVKDLKELFHRYGKEYCEGERARSFIETLDLELICAECRTLREGIEKIRDRGLRS